MVKDFASEKLGSREFCENQLYQDFANKANVFYESDIMIQFNLAIGFRTKYLKKLYQKNAGVFYWVTPSD